MLVAVTWGGSGWMSVQCNRDTCALTGFNLIGSSATSSRAAVMWASAAEYASEVQPAPKPVFPWFHS